MRVPYGGTNIFGTQIMQEVKYRKVLEDDGERQLVEVEQAACWRFLWFSGTLSVCVVVDQDRRTNTVSFNFKCVVSLLQGGAL